MFNKLYENTYYTGYLVQTNEDLDIRLFPNLIKIGNWTVKQGKELIVVLNKNSPLLEKKRFEEYLCKELPQKYHIEISKVSAPFGPLSPIKEKY
ncbi:hypothetical protein [Enterococcus faecalis]|uniref:hypothetical protein n=1 Tax=Enterococcus faecalis TaxID=1351 RepID=UPI0034CD18A3